MERLYQFSCLKKKSDQDIGIQIPLNPPFSKGEVFLLPLISDPERSPTRRAKGGAAVQSRITHAKQSSGTLAPDGGEGFYEAFFKPLKCYGSIISSLGSGSRKMGDPGVNPSDRVDGICAIRWGFIRDKKILCNRFFHPFFKPTLLFDCPSAIAHFPYLISGFIRRLTEGWSGNKKNQKENPKRHGSILKRMIEDCQPGEKSIEMYQ